MYKDGLLKVLIGEFGIEAIEKFCEIESRRYEIIAGQQEDGSFEQQETLYESSWWQTAKNLLSETINKNIKGEHEGS